MWKLWQMIVLFLSFAMGFGCNKTSTEASGASAVAQEVMKEGNGMVEVKRFNKTDGKLEGSKYDLEYDVDLVILRDCYGYANKYRWGFFSDNAFNTLKAIKAGTVIPMKGHVAFEKSESGW